jgi:1-acyl-sn-glycerol-3-phosphate acyltransferase
MLSHLPRVLSIALAFLAIAGNTVLHATPLLALGLLKALLPHEGLRARLSRWLVVLAESWIGVNSWLIDRFTPTRIHVEGADSLRYEGWYLVLSNHQSWVDIPVLQYAFNRRIPFLKFFLKRQLIWVPVLGLAWWALDFPFMRRHTPEQLARRPELRGRDLAATREACRRFRRLPVSVMNFVEGTRLTPQKLAKQQGAFQHLLRPKAGGVAFVLGAMGDTLQSILDVDIVYPQDRSSLAEFMAGRLREVRVQVRELPVPQDLVGGDYEGDAAYRERFQAWINALWQAKDARIAALLGESSAPAAQTASG